jgi:hypothetical protein
VGDGGGGCSLFGKDASPRLDAMAFFVVSHGFKWCIVLDFIFSWLFFYAYCSSSILSRNVKRMRGETGMEEEEE